MSGWVTPPGSSVGSDTPGPVVGWAAPEEPEGLGVRDVAREGWALIRPHLWIFAAITAVPTILLDLLIAPLWISTGRMFEQMATFWTTVDWTRYAGDPDALERDMEAAMRPATDLAVLGIVGGGLAFVITIIGLAAVTAATLESGRGRRPSFAAAYRAVGAHLGAIVLPALLLGLGYIVLFTPLTLTQDRIMFEGSAASQGLSALLGLVALVLEVLVFYLAIRWALYFQVVLEEGLGLRAALARSAELSSGVRIRIGLIIIVWSIIVGVTAGLVAVVIALVVGVATGSVAAGLIAYTVAYSLAALVILPFFLGILTYVYRRRVDDLGPGPEPAGAV